MLPRWAPRGRSWAGIANSRRSRRPALRRDATASSSSVTPGSGSRVWPGEVQDAAQREGAFVEWVQATRSAAGVPLAAVADLVPNEVRNDDIVALMRRCGEELRGRAGSRGIVIGVDDAQLLDPVSAALLLHLATSGSAFVLVTVRAGEPCPDAIVSLWKDDTARRMELAYLIENAIRSMVEAALDDPVEEAALDRVARSAAETCSTCASSSAAASRQAL